jgi:two-component system cell cycle sensor histidine kinase/response regulator CckA
MLHRGAQIIDSARSAGPEVSSEQPVEITETSGSLELLFDAALDAIVGMNAAGQITHWNRSAEVIFGWRKQEAIGKEMASVIIPERLREAHRRGLQRYLRGGGEHVLNRRLEMLALRQNGSEFPVELTIVPVPQGRGVHFFGFLRDISDRKLIEELEAQRLLHLELLYECSLLAQRDMPLEETLGRCLSIICRLTDWEVGHVYLPDHVNRGQLISSEIWHFASERYQELATTTAHFVFTKGQGLPGRIWESGEPEWISILASDPNFPRGPFFIAVGLKSGFGFPVGRERVEAVLEFFSTQTREPEHYLILAVKTISELVTRVFERQTDQT